MLTNTDADLLIVSLLKIPTLLEKAMGNEITLFDPVMFPAHSALWKSIIGISKAVHTFDVKTLYLRADCKNKYAKENPALLADINAILDLVDATKPEDVSEEISAKILSSFSLTAAKSSWVDKLTQLHSVEELNAFINKASATCDKIETRAASTIEEPLMNPDKCLSTSIKVPVGVRWIDVLSEGGHSRGEVVGVLGPSGGGKSTTSVQILMAQAKRKQHTVLFTYEQSIVGDFAERLYCHLFDDRPVDFFRNTPYSKWSDEDKAIWKQRSALVGPYLHVLDFAKKGTEGGGGVRDISDALIALQKKGQKITYVIIDWLWPMVTRYCALNNLPTDEEYLRTTATAMIQALKTIAIEQQVIIVVFHQLNTEMNRASPNKKPVITDAMNLRNFAFLMDVCYVIGNRDKQTNVMWLLTDKNRRGGPKEIMGKLVGDYCRIEEATGIIQDNRGRFVREDEAISEEDNSDDYGPAFMPYG